MHSSRYFRRSALTTWLPTLLALGVVATMILVAPDAYAQDEDVVEGKSFLSKLGDAGFWMAPIYICSLIMIGLYVFNFIQLSKAKFCPDPLRLTLLEHMQACRVRSAIEVASTSPTYLGRMLTQALPHVDATDPESLGREHVEDHIATFTVNENRPYMTTLGYFAILGQAAPMLGLLGTVAGMIGAFGTLETQKGADPSALAGDISVALFTTAGGLIIAIPSIFGYFFFRNRLNGLVATCHASASDMMDAAINTVNADQQLAKVPEGLQEGEEEI